MQAESPACVAYSSKVHIDCKPWSAFGGLTATMKHGKNEICDRTQA